MKKVRRWWGKGLIHLISFQLAFAHSIALAQAPFPANDLAAQMASFQERRLAPILQEYSENALEADREGDEVPPLEFDVPAWRPVLQEAHHLKNRVRRQLFNLAIPAEDRRQLLLAYVEHILMPMFDLTVHTHSPEFEHDLLITFPTELANGELIEGKIDNPWNLDIIPRDGQSASLSFAKDGNRERKIISLIKVPTADNYTRAAKWLTLELAFQEVLMYRAMTGGESASGPGGVEVPRNCQSPQNGNWPSVLESPFTPQNGEALIQSALFATGFLPNSEDFDTSEYYLNHVIYDPTSEWYPPSIPWERNRAILQGAGPYYPSALFNPFGQSPSHGPYLPPSLRPDLDDRLDFSTVLQAMQWTGGSNLTAPSSCHSWWEYLYKNCSPNEELFSEAQQIVQGLIPQAEEGEYYPEKAPYLAQLMEEKGASGVADLMGKDLLAQLESTTIKIPLPSLYGSRHWRDWALMQLGEWAEGAESDPQGHALGHTVKQICREQSAYDAAPSSLCPAGTTPDTSPSLAITPWTAKWWEAQGHQFAVNVQNTVAQLLATDEYTPTQRLNVEEWQNHYRTLARLWNYLRDRTDQLPAAYKSEKDYLQGQWDAGNPWAIMRTGYLIARQENPHLESVLEELILPIKLHLPLIPHHGNRVLHSLQKNTHYQTERDLLQESSPLLFGRDTQGQNDTYQKLQRVASQVFLSLDQVEEFVAQNPDLTVSDKAQRELDALFESELGRRGEFLHQLYQMRGDTVAQERRFLAFLRTQGGTSLWEAPYQAKADFLALDSRAKLILFQSLAQRAAGERSDHLLSQIEDLCQLSVGDHEGRKALFYATTGVQKRFDELDSQSVPSEERVQEIKAKMGEMSPEEWADLWYAGGSIALAFTVIGAGAACTWFSGGLCAPWSLAMLGAGLGSMGLQGQLARREWGRKLRANDHQGLVRSMQNLGFAEAESEREVGRTWFFAGLETVFIFPLLGITARSLKVGGKSAATILSTLWDSVSKEGWKGGLARIRQAGRRTFSEEEVGLARIVLGFEPRATSQLFRAKNWSEARAILRRAWQTGNTVVDESAAAVDTQTAKVVAQFFDDEPAKLGHLLESYLRKLKKYAHHAQTKTPPQGRGLWKGMRRQYYKRAERLRELVAPTEKAIAELRALQASGGSLQEYLANNIDELGELLTNLPMRKREMPLLALQGIPQRPGGGGSFLMERLYHAQEGLMMRAFFKARSQLTYEIYKRQARQALNLAPQMAADATATSVQAFHQAVQEAAAGMNPALAQDLLAKLKLQHFEDGLTRQVWDNLLASKKSQEAVAHLKRLYQKANKLSSPGNQPSAAEWHQFLRRILFSPRGPEELATSDTVWRTVPAEKILGLDELGEVAEKAVAQLSQYQNVGEFDHFLNALKVLLYSKRPNTVDIL